MLCHHVVRPFRCWFLLSYDMFVLLAKYQAQVILGGWVGRVVWCGFSAHPRPVLKITCHPFDLRLAQMRVYVIRSVSYSSSV